MRQTGTVKFFNQTKGYGFITPDEGGKDVFVHVTAVERSGMGTLDEGMRVSFDTEPDKRGKGPKAVNLQQAGVWTADFAAGQCPTSTDANKQLCRENTIAQAASVHRVGLRIAAIQAQLASTFSKSLSYGGQLSCRKSKSLSLPLRRSLPLPRVQAPNA